MQINDTILIFVVLPIFYVVGTYAASWAGWRQLSNHFKTERKDTEGITFSRATIVIKFAVYSRLVRITISDRGIYIALALPILLFHPAITIPWSSLEEVRRRAGPLGKTPQVVVQTENKSIVINVTDDVYEVVERIYKSTL